MNTTLYESFIFLLLVRLFHGTNPANAGSIDRNGLMSSRQGRLGPGIYFAEKAIADKVARSWGYGSYVIEIELDVGNMKRLSENEADPDGDWQYDGYDTCHAIHPPWEGVTNHSFKEWCVPNSKRVEIIQSYQTDAITQFSSPPRTPILARGKNKIQVRHGTTNVIIHSDHEDDEVEMLVTKSKKLHITAQRQQRPKQYLDSDSHVYQTPVRSTRTKISNHYNSSPRYR